MITIQGSQSPNSALGAGAGPAGGSNGLPNGYNGVNGMPSSTGTPAMPHVNDLLQAPVDVDPNLSIKRLVEVSEQSLQLAESSRNFNRPVTALREYIKASVIAINVISHHQDYAHIQHSHTDTAKAHRALLNRINEQHFLFKKIKNDVIADNKRSGVQPTLNGQATANFQMTPPLVPTVVEVSSASGSKARPPVGPKPRSLHGNSLQQEHQRGASAGLDLIARMEKLQGPATTAGRDIRTKDSRVAPPRPLGPRNMPHRQESPITIDTTTPELPRAPDAIYSPNRGSISAEAAQLPSSSSNLPLGRTNSSVSINNNPTALHRQQSGGYFSRPAEPSGINAARRQLELPRGDTISAEALYNAMKADGTILMIDVRWRELFDEGHIMTSPIICIEPSILLRRGISAADISESLVIAPGNEQEIFNQLPHYDLVVFYDQSSRQLPKVRRNSDDDVICTLRQALVDFNFDRQVKNPPPRLLEGGLDAWTDLMGPQSLQTTTGATSTRASRRVGSFVTRRSSMLRPPRWQAKEVAEWNEEIRHEEDETAASPGFARTTEEFFTQGGPVSSGPAQSMTGTAQQVLHQTELAGELPTIPTRPPAALPRNSHSGLVTEQHEEESGGTSSAATKQWTGRSIKQAEPQISGSEHFRTGLRNPHNWCYANSVLQSLLGSPGFGEEVADTKCPDSYKAPRKPDEKIDNPQLLLRIVSNLFHWMSSGKFRVMQADTLMKYSRHVASISGARQFGGSTQQDADEYFLFLLEQLDDETNINRNVPKSELSNWPPKNQPKEELLRLGKEFWSHQLRSNLSIIDKYWRGVGLQTTTCLTCRTETYMFSPFLNLPIALHQFQGTKVISLDQVLKTVMQRSEIENFQCDTCIQNTGDKQHKTKVLQHDTLLRFPILLRMTFNCYDESGSKLNNMVQWDFEEIDLTPIALGLQANLGAGQAPAGDPAFEGPFKYECYAVILHAGGTVNSGHYISYVRDRRSRFGTSTWIRYNDSNVTRVTVKGPDSDFAGDRQRFTPYVALFRRKWS